MLTVHLMESAATTKKFENTVLTTTHHSESLCDKTASVVAFQEMPIRQCIVLWMSVTHHFSRTIKRTIQYVCFYHPHERWKTCKLQTFLWFWKVQLDEHQYSFINALELHGFLYYTNWKNGTTLRKAIHMVVHRMLTSII